MQKHKSTEEEEQHDAANGSQNADDVDSKVNVR